MKSMFFEISKTVSGTEKRSGFSTGKILKVLGIPRAWYYRQLDFHPILDRRFNPFDAVDDGWIVIGFKHRNPKMSFREIAYALMDEDLAYLSTSTVYNILEKHGLIMAWRHPVWESTRPQRAERPYERWQTDIMYVMIAGRFFYLIIFIDEYNRYLVHHALLP